MRTAMINAMRYWIFAANIDGFRCDFADNPPLNFWKQTIDNLRSIKSHKLVMLAEGKRSENFTAGFDLNFGFNFYYDALKAIHNGASVGKIQTVTDIEYSKANGTQMVARYTGNHDTNGSEGTPLEVFGGTAGVMANFVVAAYMRGVPFLYGGQEVAFDKRIPFPWDGVKIDWTQNPGVTAEFKKVIGFRNSSTAIRRGTMLNYSDLNVCAFTKISGTEKVLVFSNLRSTTSDYIMPAALAGTYKDAYTGATVILRSSSTLSLSGFQYRTLTARNNPATIHLSVSPLNSSIAVGTTQQLTETQTPANANHKPVTWNSSNTNIATVDESGLVTGIAPGSVTITAATNGNKMATSAVTVIPPHTFTVHFFRPSNWGTGINIYWYNAEPAGSLPSPSWPGVSMTNEVDGWYSYTFTNITSATVIFNDGTNQSADVNRGTTGWYVNGAWYDTKPQTSTNSFTVNFYRPSDWGTGINVYWYNALPATSAASPSWPGAAMTNNGDGWYSYTFNNMDSATVIFNDGTKQSADVTRGKTGWYVNGAWYDTKPNTFTVNFFRPSDWGTGINVYWYNAQPEGSLPSPSWPGVAMTNNGDGWYSYTFINISSATLIFNDGAHQTPDGARDKTGWYLNGVWYDTNPITSATTYTVNFFRPSNWGTGINIYWYNAEPSESLPSPSWPGVSMTDNGDDWYSYTFNNISSAILIFNDGTNQTPDGARDKTGWYLNGVWYDTRPATLAARSAVKPTDVEKSTSSLMKIFPNPATGNAFNIYIPGLNKNELATLSIMDVNGRTALRTQVHQSEKIGHHLKSGLYFLKISASGINVTKKLILQ
ncbi:MAG: starch-binding protein [Segetibacter sp.]